MCRHMCGKANVPIDACHSVSDLRDLARRRLPRPLFDFLDGGAEGEATLQRNGAAFDEQRILPRCLVDVSSVKTSTRILGQRIEWPLFCSATGASRLFHPDGELAVARAAAKCGTLYSLATGSTYDIESISAASAGPKVFQIYVYKDRAVTWELIERARAAGYGALCVTVDAPSIGKRERDLRSGFPSPIKKIRSAISYAAHPRWLLGQARVGPIKLANFSAHRRGHWEIDSSLTWPDLEAIAARWSGPIALKGLMRADDARRACEVGATAIVVSNHGGRQLDGAASPLDVLSEVVEAVQGSAEIILDSGIRRGSHILKALALGANACSIGRPYLYGLAAAGEVGVTKALDILRTEFVLAMQLAGCRDLVAISPDLLRSHR